MTNLETFMIANPADPRVVRINKIAALPLAFNSKLGRLIGELMRELEAA